MTKVTKTTSGTLLIMLMLLLKIPLSAGESRIKARIRDRIAEQRRACPQVEVRDMYKMFYQAAFGVRHLLDDPEGARRYLLEELATVEPDSGPLLEPISPDGRVVRVRLARFKALGLPAERLFEAMTESARSMRGRPRELARWWRLFDQLTAAGEFDFDHAEIAAVAAEIAAGGAAPHHSRAYETGCRPHYRVVTRKILRRCFPGPARRYFQ